MSKPTIIVKNEKISVVSRGIQGPAGPAGPQGATGPQGPAGASGVTDHGALNGLGNDDHDQYWNNVRGAVAVRATTLEGLAGGSNQAIAATDTILAAFANLQAQISGFAGMAIGGAIGGNPADGQILYSDAEGNLAQSANLKWLSAAGVVQILGANAGLQMYGGLSGRDFYFAGATGATDAFKFTNINGLVNPLTLRLDGGSPAALFAAYQASVVPVRIALASSQTANALEVRSSANALLFAVDPRGGVTIADPGYQASFTVSDLNGQQFRVDTANGFVALRNSLALSFRSGAGADEVCLKQIAANVLGIYSDLNTLNGAAIRLKEMTAPGAPSANEGTLYLEDNGSGKTRLMARFASGPAQQIAIEP